MNRRSHLKSLGLLTAAGIIAPKTFAKSFSFDRKKLLPQNKNVIIIGAGASGLKAAADLKAAGAIVTILEASNTYGGRVRPLNGFADFPVELGAEEVEGWGNQNGNPPSFLYKNIHDYNPALLLDTKLGKEYYQLDNGAVWGPDGSDPDVHAFWNFYDHMYQYSGADVTMKDYLLSQYGIDQNFRTYHFYEGYIGAEFGTSVSRLGMWSIARSENLWLTGNKVFVLDDSYLSVLTTLYFQPVLSNIIYNSQVVSVNYTSTGKVKVKDQNNITYKADAVLVTIPLQQLKNNVISFNPVLPSAKQSAISTIGMDHGMKIILKFNNQFWNNKLYDLLVRGYSTEAWLPGKLKTNATNNIFTFFIMGENAEYMHAQGSNAINICLQELDTIFGAGAASNHLTDAFIQDWFNEPFVGGAYSYPSPGTYAANGDSMHLALATPVNQKLFFAGEATNDHHPSTVHGALESGVRAAAEIVDALNLRFAYTPVETTDATAIISFDGNTATVTLNLHLIKVSDVTLEIVSSTGIKKSLTHQTLTAGNHEIRNQLKGISSGVYIIVANVGTQQFSKEIFVK